MCVFDIFLAAIHHTCQAISESPTSTLVRLGLRCTTSGISTSSGKKTWKPCHLDGGQQKQERPVTGRKPSLFRTLTYAVQRRIMRLLAPKDNVKVHESPDAGQAVVHSQMEETESRLFQTVLETSNSN